MKCPACSYEPKEYEDKFIEIEGTSIYMRDKQKKKNSVNLIGCPKCRNIFMEEFY